MENYFGFEENEIKSINFMNVNSRQIYDILIEYYGNYLVKLVYFSEQNKIKSIKQSLAFDNSNIRLIYFCREYWKGAIVRRLQ